MLSILVARKIVRDLVGDRLSGFKRLEVKFRISRKVSLLSPGTPIQDTPHYCKLRFIESICPSKEVIQGVPPVFFLHSKT